MNATFRALLANTLVANIATNFVWFAVTFWVYLETRSVLATGVLGGGFMALMAVVGVPFGTFVDRHQKNPVMLAAAAASSCHGCATQAVSNASHRCWARGEARGMAVVFILVSAVGMVATIAAFLSPAYRVVSRSFAESPASVADVLGGKEQGPGADAHPAPVSDQTDQRISPKSMSSSGTPGPEPSDPNE